MEMDASFWAMIALFIFLGIIIYARVPGMLYKSLDDRAEKIQFELNEARKLREDAQKILADYQRRHKEAEAEVEEIIVAARHEADIITAQAKAKAEEFVISRTTIAENRIAQAEMQALDEVKSSAIDMAISTAQIIIADELEGKTADKIIKNNIQEISSCLNLN